MELLHKIVRGSGSLAQRETWGGDRCTLTLCPEGGEPVELEEVWMDISFDFYKADALFLNGYQSWTYSPERSTKQADKALRHVPKALDRRYGLSQYGDGWFDAPLSQKETRHGCKKGYTYAYARWGKQFHLFASLAEDTGFTRISFRPEENLVRFEKDCAGRVLRPGETYTALDLVFPVGDENEVFDAWFAAMGVKALPAVPKLGYSSWYNCYQNISEAQILRDLDGLHNLPVKPHIFQIDDGFEPFVGDWMTVNPEKFPNGIEPIIQKILDDGYQAGIWLAPFVAERDSVLYKEHPDWFQSRNGARVYAGSNWSGHYALDPYNPELRDYLRSSVQRYKDMGVTLFKLDFLYAACMSPRPDKTRGEIMADSMSFLRELVGDCEILACGVPLASAFGRVEYCRIGPDMSLDFDDKPWMRLLHNERPSTLHTQRNTLYRRQLDGRAFCNDPDVFLLREENTTLSDEQKHTLAIVNALFGSVLFSSDDFSQYDEKKRRLFAALCELQSAKVLSIDDGPRSGRLRTVIVTYRLNGEEKRLELRV